MILDVFRCSDQVQTRFRVGSDQVQTRFRLGSDQVQTIRLSQLFDDPEVFDDPQVFDDQLEVQTLIIEKSTVIPSSPMVLFVCNKSDCTNFERTQFCLVSSKQKLSIPSRVSQLTGCPGWGTRLLIDTPSHLFFSLRQHPVGEVQRVERKSSAIRKCWKIL